MEEKNVNNRAVLIDADDIITTSIGFDQYEESRNVELDAQNLSGIGRFLNVTATIKRVCPNKRIAVGMTLYETTGGGRIAKGYKTFVASHSESCCADIKFNNIRFILPEEIAETTDPMTTCRGRTFEMDCVAHYVDVNCSEC